MSNTTMEKFGFPDTLIRDFGHWVVLVRPAQVTLGSVVLASTSDATRYGALPPEAFEQQREAVSAIERGLAEFCSYERINYLMLMMVDPNVHFHVVPRYSAAREWHGLTFADEGWPGPPSLGSAQSLDPSQLRLLRDELKRHIARA